MAGNNSRRDTLRRLGALGVLAALPGYAAAQAASGRARRDVDYREIAPQPVPPAPVIEVVEFFWYGCPYCDQLQPHLAAWWSRKPENIVLRRVPAVFRPSWLPHARLYYALEALGEIDRLHHQVYASYHAERVPLNSNEEIADWAVRYGIDRQRWLTTFASAEVDRQVMQAREALARYSVSGTPSLVVDGRYLTSSGMTPGVAAMIPVLDDLIALARTERAGR